MKAQINKLGEDVTIVSIYNNVRIVNQKYFDTERKAKNYCAKYGYEIANMSKEIDYSLVYEK